MKNKEKRKGKVGKDGDLFIFERIPNHASQWPYHIRSILKKKVSIDRRMMMLIQCTNVMMVMGVIHKGEFVGSEMNECIQDKVRS